MRLKKNRSDAELSKGDATNRRRREGGGWGPFTGGQLTVVIVAIAAMFAIPTAALAVGGAFSNNSATVPAVKATNANAHGIGVQGTGKKFGVLSNGPLGVAAGKPLSCTGCVGAGALSSSARTGQLVYSHTESFTGPYGAVPTFTGVPAGLACATGTASAFTTTPSVDLEEAFVGGPVPTVELKLFANTGGVHMALVDSGTEQCKNVLGGNYTYNGVDVTGNTSSDGSDHGSITLQVFHQ